MIDTYYAAGSVDDLINKMEPMVSSWGLASGQTSMFTSIMAAYWRNTIAYHSSIINPDTWESALGYRGDVGELVSVVIPVSTTLVDQFASIIAKQKLYYECTTDSTGSDPAITTRLGKAIANSLVEKFDLDNMREEIARLCSIHGTVFASSVWRSDKGYAYARYPNGVTAFSGDTHIELHDMHEVVWNWSIPEWKNLYDCILKRRMNRWDLIAQYPELEDEIRAFPSARQERMSIPRFGFMCDFNDDEVIYVREYYHKKTPALPNGRMIAYLNNNCVFYDSLETDDEIEELPVVQFAFKKMHLTSLGLPWFSDLLPAQEMFDNNFSVQATNYSTFGVQNILTPRGSDLTISDIAHGAKNIVYTPTGPEGGGKPEALQLTAPPPGIEAFSSTLERHMNTLSKINDALKGNAQPNVTSGAMAATLATNAMEFLNTNQMVISKGIAKLVNIAIQNMKKYATVEQILDITGPGTVSYVKRFKAEDISAIKKIRIKEQNPMMSMVAGRLQFAESIQPMLQSGNFEAASKYSAIIEGSPVEEIFANEFDQNIGVQKEVEALYEGKPVAPQLFQNHPIYIRAYMRFLSDPELLTRSELITQVVELMEIRANLELQFQQTNPQLYSILRGVPPPQVQMNPQGPMPQPQEQTDPASAPAQPAQPMIGGQA